MKQLSTTYADHVSVARATAPVALAGTGDARVSRPLDGLGAPPR